MEEEIGKEIGEDKEETTIADMVRIGRGGIGVIGIIIGTGITLHLVKAI